MTLPNKTAIQQLAAHHFTSLGAFINYLDELLERLAWAYTGVYQREIHQVQDYDLIKKLKQAIAQDLQGVGLQFCPPPFLPPYDHHLAIRPCLQRPAIDSVAKATRLAKARGLRNFEVKKGDNDELYLVIYMSLKELDECLMPLWGLYNEERQILSAYHLHLM
ncbi:hypothetical protein [uncultured Microscilla sp.]|uniref:hypothetical protein n=1 Tax=uncultured Microscilla sp. TaxID=432653 RepID=UPI002632FA91|nr:hypothetical protein [uncultured Microscilla sp.]